MIKKKMKMITAGFLMIACTGCIPDYTNKNNEDALLKKGEPLLQAYADTLGEGYTVADARIETAAALGQSPYTGTYLSNVISAEITGPEDSRWVALDMETGQMYREAVNSDLCSSIEEQLNPYCERYGFEGTLTVNYADYAYCVFSHDVPTNRKDGSTDTELYFTADVLPIEYFTDDGSDPVNAALEDHLPLHDLRLLYSDRFVRPLDPRVLADYLKETGNYITEERSLAVYTPSYGVSDVFNEVCFEPLYYDLTTFFNPAENEYNYRITRYETITENGITVRYASGMKQGSADTYETDVFEEYECPAVFKDGKLIYTPGEYQYAHLYFTEEASVASVSRILIEDGKEQEPETMKLFHVDSSHISITEENAHGYYAYTLKTPQILTFETK